MRDLPVSDAPAPAPASPCIGFCQLDVHGVCLGCRRTVQEISHWSGCSPAQKLAILRRLQHEQQAAHSSLCPQCGMLFPCLAGAAQGCWCQHMPPVGALPATLQGCLCPRCLRRQLAAQDNAWPV